VGDGVAMPDGTEHTGTDDTAALKSALGHLEAQGDGTLRFGPKRYMIDLPELDQIDFDLSNIRMVGVPGATVLDFTRTDGFYNGAIGMDGIARPYGFIKTTGSKYGGSTYTITSGVYSTNTGAVVLTMASPVALSAGNTVTLAITSGTGAWAQISGTYTAINTTSGTTVTVAASPGLGATTITGGTVLSVDGGYLLTADTIEPVGAVARTIAGSRSGTTITLVMDAPHGLVIGNLIWSTGDPDITDDDEGDLVGGQMCFFTVGGRAVGLTTPVAVTGISTTTVTDDTFTFEYAGDVSGQDTVMDLSAPAWVFHASSVIKVADTSVFSRGERVLIGSLRERGRDNEHCNIGEYQIVARILSSTLLRLQSDVRETYAVADMARVFKLSQIKGVVFDGITIEGKGHNIDTYYEPGHVIQRGDVGMLLTHTDGLRIRNCKFVDCDLTAVGIVYASDVLIEDNIIVQDKRDEAGAVSAVPDIEYGFNIGACIDDITFQRNSIYGGRHAIVQGGSSSDFDFGVVRVARFINNYCAGQWLEAISTHQGADTLIYTGNHITGARGGINPRYAKNVIISNNLIVCKYNGVVLYNDVTNALISNNILDAGSYPIWIKTISNPIANIQPDGYSGNVGKLSAPYPAGPSIQITGNQIRNGRNGIYCVDPTPGLTITGLEITDNSITRSRDEPIRISVGNPNLTTSAITSGTYNDTTGAVVLVLTSAVTNIRANVPFTLSGLTGTGAFASLNGDWKAISPTATSVGVTTVYFMAPSGLGASTITGGTITLPYGGWTGMIANNRIYNCSFNNLGYQLRLSNAIGVKVNNNSFVGTSTFAYAILVEGASSTACEFMSNSVASTLYSTALFSSAMDGTGHRTDMTLRENVTIVSGVAALKFVTTKHLRLRGEGSLADDLTSITGAGQDQELTLSTQSTSFPITVKHGSGFELETNADKLLDDPTDRMRVMWSDVAAKWLQTTLLMNHA
jgi:hypothetical protein